MTFELLSESQKSIFEKVIPRLNKYLGQEITLTYKIQKATTKTDRQEHYIQQLKTSSSAFTLLYDGLGLKDKRN